MKFAVMLLKACEYKERAVIPQTTKHFQVFHCLVKDGMPGKI